MMSADGDTPTALTGGCLCGAIRFTIQFNDDFKWPLKTSICQCTMCRKAIGAMVPQFVYVPSSAFHPRLDSSPAYKKFASSPDCHRTFCAECGSSFAWQSNDSDVVGLVVGTLDEECLRKHGRALATPNVKQLWMENAIPGVTDLLKGGKEHPRGD
jgi:hypothetical protein